MPASNLADPTAPRVQLLVETFDASTPIEVLDGNLRPIPLENNLGRVLLELAPGAYAVRFHRGNSYTQKVVVLAADQPNTTVGLSEEEAPRFATAAPIRHTSTTREFHRGPAEQLSKSIPLGPPPGQSGGSHLVILVRDLEPSQSPADPANLLGGLTLHQADGTQLYDIAAVGDYSFGDSCAGVHLQIDPGSYLLRQSDERGRFHERMIATSPGWQTQLFSLAADGRNPAAPRRANLARQSILMTKEFAGFDPGRADLCWTEAALRALERKSNQPADDQRGMLGAKFENPMLGIYGALLHLRRREIDLLLMREVFNNLVGMLGETPDVLAIGWGMAVNKPELLNDPVFVAQIAHPALLGTPPMLRESWQHVVQATTLDAWRELIPASSLAGRIAGQLTSSGAWLAWKGEPASDHESLPSIDSVIGSLIGTHIPPLLTTFARGFSFLLSRAAAPQLPVSPKQIFEQVAQFLQNSPDLAKILSSHQYSAIEKRVIEYIAPLANPALQRLVEGQEFLRNEVLKQSGERDVSIDGLLKHLAVPAGTALQAVAGLFSKLLT